MAAEVKKVIPPTWVLSALVVVALFVGLAYVDKTRLHWYAADSAAVNAAARQAVIDSNREENAATQTAIDAKYIAPGATAPANYDDGKAWRGEKRILDYAVREQWKTLEKAMPYTGPESTNSMRLAMNEWGAVMDKAKSGTVTDYDQVDKWMADNPAKADLVNENLAGKVNKDLTAVVTAYKAASKAVGDSGYFGLKDKLWAEMNNDGDPAPGYVRGQGYNDWENAQIASIKREMIADGVSKTLAPEKAREWVASQNNVVQIFDKAYKKQALYPWVDAHPNEAALAVKWGYLKPDKLIKGFLQEQGK